MNTETFKYNILAVKDKLYRFALRLLQDPAEAQDAVQEVFIKLWTHREKLAEIDNLEAWSMRLTKNVCIDKLRSRHRQTESLDWQHEREMDAQSPHDTVVARETVQKIRTLMEHLPEKQKLVMHLRDIEGMSYQEIGSVLDLSESQVKVNLFRARKKIQAYLLKSG